MIYIVSDSIECHHYVPIVGNFQTSLQYFGLLWSVGWFDSLLSGWWHPCRPVSVECRKSHFLHHTIFGLTLYPQMPQRGENPTPFFTPQCLILDMFTWHGHICIPLCKCFSCATVLSLCVCVGYNRANFRHRRKLRGPSAIWQSVVARNRCSSSFRLHYNQLHEV